MRLPLIPYSIPEFAASDSPVTVYYRLTREIEEALYAARARVIAISQAKRAQSFGQEHDADLAAQDGHATCLEALGRSVERIKCDGAMYGPGEMESFPAKIVVNLLVALSQGEFDSAAPKS